ncbi:MAG: alkaline phosphatase family protein [Gammaproteobacteria bacterium]
MAVANGDGYGGGNDPAAAYRTATPIKHLVVIFQENVSFDHYFATYPKARNPVGEPRFEAARGTPQVNNLANADLLTNNPNDLPANGTGASDPFRLDRTQSATADQNHAYTPEQEAYDDGKADLFPKYTGSGTSGGAGAFGTTGQVMGYYDGNTVTALWNYAQRFAMSDDAYTDTYGPSTPGAVEVISGQTNGLVVTDGSKPASYVENTDGSLTLMGDMDPGYDVCSSSSNAILTGKNIGDLLNAKGISWGGFMGGFDLTVTNPNNTVGCARSTYSYVVDAATADYIPHHNWFQYYKSTSNPEHLRPSSVDAIGHTDEPNSNTLDPANHEYDVRDFFAAVKAGNFPAVSYLKAPAYQDGHAGYSDPLDEQTFITNVVNFLEQQPEWKDTAVIVTWDDSDGWYDHRFATTTSSSYDTSQVPSADQLNGPGICGTGTPPDGLSGQPVNGRCGPGTRLPFLVISPYAKRNYVSHTYISQASVVRFIEDNWLNGERLGGGSFDASTGSIMDMFDFYNPDDQPLYLYPQTGTLVQNGTKEHAEQGIY